MYVATNLKISAETSDCRQTQTISVCFENQLCLSRDHLKTATQKQCENVSAMKVRCVGTQTETVTAQLAKMSVMQLLSHSHQTPARSKVNV